MIPQETIEQIRTATDIVDVIGEYVRLKKRGKSFFALCPFHTEKTPSFHVSPDKQIFHCFGCGKGGNVFTFLMEHEKMSFVEAVRHLANKAGIVIREEKSDYQRDVTDKIYFANEVALSFFRKTLRRSKYSSVLDGYLKKKRGMTDDSIETFQLGLAGDEWEGLINAARRQDLTPEDLEKAGLAIYSDKRAKHFDRFRQRLMIPIHNLSNRTIAFGGRTLAKGEPAKYINSPETPLYSKSNVLYGLNFAKEAIRQSGSVFIVEGYFDLISLWQVGIKNVVASSGTAFTSQQARFLARFAEEVYLFFDADSAGRNAALRSVDALYDAGLEVKIIDPPAGQDPDSLAQQFGRDKIDELRYEAIGFIEYRIKGFDRESAGIISKEKLIKELAGIAANIQDPTRRTLFYSEAANQLGVNPSIFQRSGSRSVEPSAEIGAARRQRHNAIEAGFLSLLFNNPGTLDTIFEKISPEDFDSKTFSRLYSAIIQQYNTIGLIDARKLIDNAKDDQFISLVTEIASREWEDEKIEPETRRYVEMIVNEKKKRIRARLQKELAEAEAAGDHARADSILEQLKSYGLHAKKD